MQLRAVAAVSLVALMFGAVQALGSTASADQGTGGSVHHTLVPPDPGHVDPAPPGVDVKHKLRIDELLAKARARAERKLARTTGKTGAALLAAAASPPAPTTAAATTPTGYSALPGITTHVDRAC